MAYTGIPPRPLNRAGQECADCWGDLYFSGCDWEGCPGQGFCCPDCGAGCDLDFVDDGYCENGDEAEYAYLDL